MHNLNKDNEQDEHVAVLDSARKIIKQSENEREAGRKRLENALKKYRERSENGPFRNF